MAIVSTLLIEQVRSAAPFLFDGPQPQGPEFRYLQVLRGYDGRRLDALGYYELCLCAHWATAGSFVPTDVDNAIRWKLWQDSQPGLIEAQARLVLEALRWDYAPVTARIAGRGPLRLSTHEGTWFSVAVGAYAACRESRPGLCSTILETMRDEAVREDAVFAAIEASGDAVDILKASALIAHNFGDLDRVADQWELKADDPLRPALYDAAKPGSPLFGGRLGRAGSLHRSLMSADNHRHYPLRAAKGLRRCADLLLPVGPFFDDWGRRVGRHHALTPEDVAEAVRALIDGWVRMHQPAGYARALSGILEVFSGGRRALGKLIPARDLRMLESGPLKVALDVPQERFEAQWTNLLRRHALVGLLGLILFCVPARAAIEPPDDPRQVAAALDVLKDTRQSEAHKLEALTSFTKTSNLTDDAFWTLLTVAGRRSNDTDSVKVTALLRLASSIAYILPHDSERSEHAVALLLDEKFKTAFAAMHHDPLTELRAKRLFFFGAVTLNLDPATSKRLAPVFLPLLLASFAAEANADVINEGLWSLERLLEIGAISIIDVAPVIGKIANSDPDIGVRERAAALLSSYAAPRPQ